MAAVSNFIVCFHRDARMLFGRTVYGLRKVLRTVDAGVTLQQIILTKDQGYIANGDPAVFKYCLLLQFYFFLTVFIYTINRVHALQAAIPP
jgi:hypothetical protein